MEMLTPAVITPPLIDIITKLGRLRHPTEACGVLLPFPWRDRQVWEMPNRSKTPHDSFEMSSEDIVIELQDWIHSNPAYATWDKITIWHTHPGGKVGPSKTDIENRIAYCGNLVVSIPEDGGIGRPAWF